MSRPNLFIVGAMKSGTTSLHQYLARHPQAFMCEPKEPGFFVEELTWSRGWDWYLDLFAEAGDARIVGESSTHYAKLPTYRGVPERISQHIPDSRIVYVMRDPLDRIESHYWHNVNNLFLEAERRDFTAALRESPEYLAYSDYAMQLDAYFRVFGRERVYCTTFETLTRTPASETAKLCRWLGLDGDIPADAFEQKWNARPEAVRKAKGLGLLNRFAHSAVWDRLSPLTPTALKRFAGAMAAETVRPSRHSTADVLAMLRPRFHERVDALSELLGRRFPEWTTLYPPPAGVEGDAPARPPFSLGSRIGSRHAGVT